MRRLTSTSDVDGVDLRQRRAAFAAAVLPEIVDRPALEIRRGVSLRHVLQDLAGPRRVALCEHEQRPRLQLRRRGALEQLLQHRDRLFRIGVEQRVDGEDLQIVVVDAVGPDRLPAVAPHFGLELFRLRQVPALGVVLRERRNRGQRFGPLSRTALRPRLPVERRVGPGALQRDDVGVALDRAVVLPLIEELARLIVGPRFAFALALFQLGLAVRVLVLGLLERVLVLLERAPHVGECEAFLDFEQVLVHVEEIRVETEILERVEPFQSGETLQGFETFQTLRDLPGLSRFSRPFRPSSPFRLSSPLRPSMLSRLSRRLRPSS